MHEPRRTGADRKSFVPGPACDSFTPPTVGLSSVSGTCVSPDSSWTQDGRGVRAGLLERGVCRVARLDVAHGQLLGLGQCVRVELAGAGVPDDPVAAHRGDLGRLGREAELGRGRRGEALALGAQDGDRALLGREGVDGAVHADGDRGVAADLRERLRLGLEAVEAGDAGPVVDPLGPQLTLGRVDHRDRPPRTSTRGAVKTRLPVAVLGLGRTTDCSAARVPSEGLIGTIWLLAFE